MSSKVKVVNAVWNGRALIRRRDAEHCVSDGRAEWVGVDQVRLILSHPLNVAAAARARAWEREAIPISHRDRMARAPNAPGQLRKLDHRPTRFKPPLKRFPRGAFAVEPPKSKLEAILGGENLTVAAQRADKSGL